MSRKPTKLRPADGGKMWSTPVDGRSEEHQKIVKRAALEFKIHIHETSATISDLPRRLKWEDVKLGAQIRHRHWAGCNPNEYITGVKDCWCYRSCNPDDTIPDSIRLEKKYIDEGQWLLVQPAPNKS